MFCKTVLLRLVLLFLSVLVLSCSNTNTTGTDKSLSEHMPTLAQMANLTDTELEMILDSNFILADFDNSTKRSPAGLLPMALRSSLANASSGLYPLDTLNIKNLTIGAQVSAIQSAYLPNSIFDISLLDKNNYLDKNLSTASQAKSEISLSSKSNANQDSSTFTESFQASVGTLFTKASLAQNYSHSSQSTSSDTAVTLTMSQNQTGAYIKIITGNMGNFYDFSPFLIGSKLDDKTINTYVSFVRSSIPHKNAQYISDLKIDDSGIKTLAQTNIYGGMQLLQRILEGFSELKNTYIKYKDDNSVSKDVKDKMFRNLLRIRTSANYAIKNFYKTNGDYFVSKVNLMNYAYGSGVLNFGSHSGITLDQMGGALSVSYQGAVAGGSGSLNIQYARQNGWAEAVKNSTVNAVSFPAGVVDTTAWVTQIQNMLSQEKEITVPALTLPTKAELTLPDPVGPRKDPNEPPSSCFQSYDEWKKYLDDKKQEGSKQASVQADIVQTQINQIVSAPESQVSIVNQIADQQGGGGEGNPALYQAYRNDILKLKELKRQRQLTKIRETAPTSNILRVDKMFVNGFEVISYDSVLPLLRADLSIPGETQQLKGYPNVIKLNYIVSLLGDLDNYLRFLSIHSLSGVTKDMSKQFTNFYKQFVSDANDKISLQLAGGHDIPNDLLSSFIAQKIGTDKDRTKSDLYTAFGGDINAVQYVIELTTPNKIRVWREAPGGYLPLTWNDKGHFFVNHDYMDVPKPTFNFLKSYLYYVNPPESWQSYTNYAFNPLGFYDISQAENKTYKTPWFPIYRYSAGKTPSLVFIQHLGPYYMVYGQTSVVKPSFPDSRVNFNSLKPYSNFQGWSHYYDTVDLGSLQNSISWDYALYFDNLPKNLLTKFNAITVNFSGFYNSEFTPNCNGSYCQDFLASALTYECTDEQHSGWLSPDFPKFVYDLKGNKIDLKYKYLTTKCVIMLLPLNDLTTNGQYKTAFMYGNNLKATDIIGDDSFNAFYNMTLFDN